MKTLPHHPCLAPGRALLVSLCLGLSCAAWGCAGYQEFIEDQADMPPTNGIAEASGGSVGTWSANLKSCTSGMREGFFGITLQSEDGLHLIRVVRNPVGPMTVAVNVPGAQGEFVAVPCRAVVGAVTGTGTRINGITVVTGDVRFSCTNLRGAARFRCS
jgi:hypothetical protein